MKHPISRSFKHPVQASSTRALKKYASVYNIYYLYHTITHMESKRVRT